MATIIPATQDPASMHSVASAGDTQRSRGWEKIHHRVYEAVEAADLSEERVCS